MVILSEKMGDLVYDSASNAIMMDSECPSTDCPHSECIDDCYTDCEYSECVEY